MVVTAKPPMPGAASPCARSSASRAGAPSRPSPGSAYVPVATTRASRDPDSGSAAGGMAGQPGIDDLSLLMRGHAGHFQPIPVDADLHAPARPRDPAVHRS